MTGHRALAPATLIDRLTSLPPMRQRLGEFPVRGKKRPLELDALGLEADAARSAPQTVLSSP